jgi:hypothetical protein
MKTVILSNGFKSENKSEIANEVANILGKNSDNDFQADGENIIEYESDDSIYWYIDSVKYYDDGTIHSVNIDC